MSCVAIIFHPDNPNVLEWQGVTNSITGNPVENADVQITLLDSFGDEVEGQTWPATMAHTADGTYRIILETDIAIIPRRSYTAHIVAEVDGDAVADIVVPVVVALRTS